MDNSRPLRVLVADDERQVAESLASLLHMDGYETFAAYDGPEVLRAAQRFHPDVVILDIKMPELSGYDAARALRARNRDVVLIALSGWKQRTDKMFARMAGFDYHFGKPCDPRSLQELLASLKEELSPRA